MIRCRFWLVVAIFLTASCLAPAADRIAAKPTAEKPNILFIFTDDQAPDTIHAWGNQQVQTPNMDRLVEAGCSFTHAHNQGGWNGAVCLASRKMINTGRFLWNAHAENLNERVKDRKMWSQLMSQAGYETYFTGKWHVDAKPEKIFDHVAHVRPGMPNQTPAGYNRPIEGDQAQWSPSDPAHGGYWQGGKHWSEVLADDAETFLASAAKSDKPFFMYLAFNAPHDPRQSPASYVGMYPWKSIELPESFLPAYPFAEAIGAGPKLRDESLAPYPRTPFAIKVNRSEYYALVSHADAQIGRILDSLKKTGKADKTYIVFTADQGLACGHHGLMGKQNMHWHSVGSPLVIVGPDIEKGRRIETRVYLQDVMPTTLELAGAAVPDDVQFRSLLPLLRGQRSQQYEAIYGGFMSFQRMVVDDGHKLILYPGVPKARLYDVEKDPRELNDLAGKPEALPIMQRLFGSLQRLQRETGDTLDLTKSFPELAK